jgi:hypothetical protein
MGELMSQGINARQSAADRREIRVFISSTFRDMHEEREELVKRIFPQLRRLCESRGVTWGEVDVRWGGRTKPRPKARFCHYASGRSRTVGFTIRHSEST